LSAAQDQADGCELPEELRRYYLDAMGIQVWDELYPQAVSADEIPVAEVAEVEVPPVVFEVSNCSWPELQSMVQQCAQCDLHSPNTHNVFGAGNQNASLLLVGEAPKQDEAEQGAPFVGEAGELLTAMLKAIDLQRDDVYITNVVKCHPADDHRPCSTEFESCYPYLQRQIALLQPKVIYAVGAMASQILLRTNKKITALQGQKHSFEGIPLIASFHPAYLLRKPGEKRKAWADLQEIKRLLAE